MTIDQIESFLPKFLSPESNSRLLHAISMFPNMEGKNHYSLRVFDAVLQGDGLDNLFYCELPNTEKTSLCKGLVLSNTCDISPENNRIQPSSLSYAPIIELEKYRLHLETVGYQEDRIMSHLKDIRTQRITQIFYLPPLEHRGLPESIVFLDRVLSIPTKNLVYKDLISNRVFSLSDFGAYLFLFKLSIHFCRMNDQVDRSDAA